MPLAASGTGIAKAATAAPPDTAERAIEFVEMDITGLVVLHAPAVILREKEFVCFFVLSAICLFPPRVPRFHVD
jgi:hypothetical protein